MNTDRCSRAESSPAPERKGCGHGARAIQAPRTPYRVVAVPDGARITGTVEMSGDAPPDTTVLPPAQARACGDSIRLPLVEHDGRRLGDVVVWLDDIRSGKPLPLTRRFSITNVGCQ